MTDDTYFPSADVADLPGSLQSLCGKAEAEVGFVPNVFLAYAHRPERFSAWFTHYSQLQAPTENLTVADRELIAVVVSAIHQCTYCLVSHVHALRLEMGVELADRILYNWRHAGLNDKQLAICRYADKLTRTPAEVDRADLETLEASGLSPNEVWDVVELTAMYSFTNRFSLAMGFAPNAEYHYQPASIDTGSQA